MYVGVQFVGEESIAVVAENWLTPSKKETFWPPYKQQSQFEKSLKECETPGKWEIHQISRCFFATGTYGKL